MTDQTTGEWLLTPEEMMAGAQISDAPTRDGAAPDISPFRVDIDPHKCPHCGGPSYGWVIVWPDGSASGRTYSEECDAWEDAAGLAKAFAMGKSA